MTEDCSHNNQLGKKSAAILARQRRKNVKIEIQGIHVMGEMGESWVAEIGYVCCRKIPNGKSKNSAVRLCDKKVSLGWMERPWKKVDDSSG